VTAGLQGLSLRGRLIACIVLVLVFSLAIGTAFALHSSARLVSTELRTALDVASRTVQSDMDDLAPDATLTGALRRRIATFDGDRHVVASLLDAGGEVLARSTLRAPPQHVPAWFRWLLAPTLPALRVPVRDRSIELVADPNNELAERWSEIGDALLQLGLFVLLAAGGVLWTTDRALLPLRALATAFARIEAGDYTAQVAERGPPEVGHVLRSFNHMAEQLAATEAQNRRLHLQLLKLQEEERADLARDLHDEIGPLLFAVNMHAATIRQLAADGRSKEIAAQVSAIRDAVGHMQKHVKAILGELRAVPPAAFGLAQAIEGLITFWRFRRPGIEFAADVAQADTVADDATRETIYRTVQESLTNAVRHGRPSRIEITVNHGADGVLRLRVADNGRGAGPAAGDAGFGLAGMRERIAALGGTLAIESGPDGGWTVTARLPLVTPEPAAALGLAP
jgi:two-component system sensor histidine kinase UhpB